jgi:hypothetical protein
VKILCKIPSRLPTPQNTPPWPAMSSGGGGDIVANTCTDAAYSSLNWS